MTQLVHESAGLLLHSADIGIREAVTIDISSPDVPTSQRDLEIVAGQLAAAGAGAGRHLLVRKQAIVMAEAPRVIEVRGLDRIEIADTGAPGETESGNVERILVRDGVG